MASKERRKLLEELQERFPVGTEIVRVRCKDETVYKIHQLYIPKYADVIEVSTQCGHYFTFYNPNHSLPFRFIALDKKGIWF